MANYSYLWKVIASIVMVCNALPVLAESGETPSEIETFTTITNMIRPGGVVVSILVLIGVWLLLRFVDRLVTNLGSIFAERRLLLHKVNAFFHFIVYLAAIIAVVLLSLKISREVMAILGGTAAVAMGFALKDLVASIVAGVMIMLDRPFQVGDRVSFGGQYGDITAIGLRSTKLQTLDDNTVTIPNNMFLNQITSCGNYGELDMQVVVDFHIGVDQNIRLAQDLVQEATVTSRYIYLPKPVTVGVSQVVINTCVTVRLRLKAYVLDTKFEKALVSDVTLRVLEAFKSQGIQPPAVLYRNIVDGHNSIQPRLVSTEKPS